MRLNPPAPLRHDRPTDSYATATNTEKNTYAIQATAVIPIKIDGRQRMCVPEATPSSGIFDSTTVEVCVTLKWRSGAQGGLIILHLCPVFIVLTKLTAPARRRS
jgi:hypothetical protein